MNYRYYSQGHITRHDAVTSEKWLSEARASIKTT